VKGSTRQPKLEELYAALTGLQAASQPRYMAAG